MSQTSAAKLVTRPTDEPLLSLLGMPTWKLLTGEETGGIYHLMEQVVPPGLGVPPHVHSREDEVFFVLEGEVQFLVDGQPILAQAGDVVHAPREVPHAYACAGEQPARVRFMVMPPQCETMFDELAALPLPPDPAAIGELCGRYGIQFVP